MKLRDETLSTEVRDELDALDAALAGDAVDLRFEGIAQLAGELRAERPVPRQEFSARLDERAGAGFPRPARTGRLAAARDAISRSRLGRRLASTPPRRLLAPVGAAVTLVVVAGVAISNSGVGEKEATTVAPAVQEAEEPVAPGATTDLEKAPAGDASGAAIEPRPSPGVVAPPFPGPPGLAPGQEERKVERAAQITLSAEADEVPDVADEVIGVADRYRGIVVSSQVTGEDGDQARATLELAIPALRLDDALRDLSELADVAARSESSLDITAPFVSARERLADARAELESLLTQLAEADTPQQTASIRERMEIVRGELAQARAQLADVARRARFAFVSVTVEADPDAGGWSFDDAAGDALDVLGFAVKVALVSLAVLVPLALVVGLGWLGQRALVGRRRERALDRPR